MKTVRDYMDAVKSVRECALKLDALEYELHDDDPNNSDIIVLAIGYLNEYIEVLEGSEVKGGILG